MPEQFEFVKVRVSRPGLHQWLNAPIHVAFLRDQHRHVFTIEADVVVGHGDRQLEFFSAQEDLNRFLDERWPSRLPTLDFGELSCEQIASVVLASWRPAGLEPRLVTVWEDGENAGGAGFL